MARYKEDAGKAQTEVDRLLEILREMENEKNDKDHKINELERYTHTHTHKFIRQQRLLLILCTVATVCPKPFII